MTASKFLIVGIIYLTGFFTFHYLAYKESLVNDTETVAFVDQTDELTTRITGKQITDFTSTDEYQWSTHTVWVEALTNYNFDNVSKSTLSKTVRITANPYKRNKDLKRFKLQIDSSLNTLYANDSSKSKSCIYEPVMRELNRISKSKAHHRFIIINSDLAENSDLLSVYRSNDFIELQHHQDKVIEKLTNRIKPENFKNIEVYFVYKPKNDEDNRRFMLMVSLFKKILESNGAEVSIGATLIHK